MLSSGLGKTLAGPGQSSLPHTRELLIELFKLKTDSFANSIVSKLLLLRTKADTAFPII